MKNKTWDSVVVLAKKDKEVISAAKWGKLWYFVYENGVDGGRIGETFSSKTEILNRAKDYILKESGYTFEESHLLDVVPKPVNLSNEEVVALNQALIVLDSSLSDYAESSSFYIRKLLERI